MPRVTTSLLSCSLAMRASSTETAAGPPRPVSARSRSGSERQEQDECRHHDREVAQRAQARQRRRHEREGDEHDALAATHHAGMVPTSSVQTISGAALTTATTAQASAVRPGARRTVVGTLGRLVGVVDIAHLVRTQCPCRTLTPWNGRA